MEADDQLSQALEQVRAAATLLRQQQQAELNVWRKRVQDLQTENEALKSALAANQRQNDELRAAAIEADRRCNQLQLVNSNLNKAIQEKDEELSHYSSISQSLRALLDKEPVRTQKETYSTIPETVYRSPQIYDAPTIHPQTPAPTPTSPVEVIRTPKRTHTGSRSGAFITTAKEQLPYQEYTKMLNEINKYNRKQQSREETIANVQKILQPAYGELQEQFMLMMGGM